MACKELYVHVTGTPTDPEDEGTPGIYLVEVNADLSSGQQASAALDVFHEHWGIEVLDDFVFEVRTDSGEVVDEDPEHTDYSLSGEGRFYGKVDDPAAGPRV